MLNTSLDMTKAIHLLIVPCDMWLYVRNLCIWLNVMHLFSRRQRWSGWRRRTLTHSNQMCTLLVSCCLSSWRASCRMHTLITRTRWGVYGNLICWYVDMKVDRSLSVLWNGVFELMEKINAPIWKYFSICVNILYLTSI